MTRSCWIVTLFALFLVPPTLARVVFVDQAAPGPAHDGSSWATACLTISQGLAIAQPGDEVWVTRGVYDEALVPGPSDHVYGGFIGNEASLDQRPPGGGGTVVVAGAVPTTTPGAHCQYAGIVLDGLMFLGFGTRFGTYNAISVTAGDTQISGCDVSGYYQNGVSVAGQSAVAVVLNSVVHENGTGVAVANTGLAVVVESTLSNSTRGAHAAMGGRLVLSGCTIKGCAQQGAYAYFLSSITMANSLVTGNGASGVHIEWSSGSLSSNRITGNGIDGVTSDGITDVNSNLIAGNSRYGVWANYVTPGTPGTVNLRNNTITRNGSDGIIVGSTTATMANTIFSGNGGYGVNLTVYGAISSFTHNDVYWNALGSASGFTPPEGMGNLSLNPKLSRGWDGHIAPDSPCRDAGDDGAAAEGSDIDGQARIQGPHVDIGADESDGAVWTAPARWFVAPAGNDAADGSSWGSAKKTIPAALYQAIYGDEAWVAKGSYAGAISLPGGVSLYGGFTGTETDRQGRTPGANPSILEGGGAAAVVSVAAEDAAIDGFTIRSGTDGVLVTIGPAAIERNLITNCSNGIAVRGGSATVRNSVVASCDQGVYINGSATLVSNTLYGNPHGVKVDHGSAGLINNIIATAYGAGSAGVFALNKSTVSPFACNDVYGFRNYAYYGFTPPADQGNLTVDPMLSRSRHIQPGSPCRDAGLDTAPFGAADCDGQPRLQGAHVDIGADESDGTAWDSPFIWYVSEAGSDLNDGAGWLTPLRTVSAAVAKAGAGQEFWVAKGTYQETLTLSQATSLRPPAALYGGFSGTETAREQRNWTANPTILDGGGSTTNTIVGIHMENVTLDGFIIQRGGYGASATYISAAFVNNVFRQNATGILAPSATVSATACAFTGNTTGIFLGGPGGAVSRCTLSGNGTGIRQKGGTLQCSSSLLSANGIGVQGGGAIYLTGNTLSGNTTGVSYSGVLYAENNIIASSSVGVESVGLIKALSHNDFFGNVVDLKGNSIPIGQGNISLDPLFADAAGGNYRLLAGSPCIDAGDDAVVGPGGVDLDGKPRILGDHVDVGAFEYGAPQAFTVADVSRCLGLAAGTQSCTVADLYRLNAEGSGPALELADALRLARKVAGLEPNP